MHNDPEKDAIKSSMSIYVSIKNGQKLNTIIHSKIVSGNFATNRSKLAKVGVYVIFELCGHLNTKLKYRFVK